MNPENLHKETQVRNALFLWLRQQEQENGGIFTRRELEKGFSYNGELLTLVGPKGIWIPAGMTVPSSITTTQNSPYDDGFDNESVLKYKYMKTDPFNRENTALRMAYTHALPLVYFHAIATSKYQAYWPVYIHNDNPAGLEITAALYHETIQGAHSVEDILISDNQVVRKYATRQTLQRMHQSAFRELVISAYAGRCTICNLQHVELLDAAHITPDSDEHGIAHVSNGLSMCKIHHAAYDRNILGVSPDYTVHIREDILHEVDGPMLKYGLQEMDKRRIILPDHRSDFPDRDRLDERYRRFAG